MASYKHKTPEDYHALANARGFSWVGELPSNTHQSTRWTCGKHEWSASYSNIAHRRSGCPTCAGRLPKTEDDYRAISRHREIDWVGDMPSGVHTKTTWKCRKCGHVWMKGLVYISAGSGCPKCAGKARITLQDYEALTSHCGYILVSKMPAKARQKGRWLCPYGHEWEASYVDISQGHGCPYCVNHVPISADGYREAARKHGLEWIGEQIPQNTRCNTEWKCPNGHVFLCRYAEIVHKNASCPHCQDRVNGQPVSKPQRDLHAMTGGDLNYPVRRYRLDIALITEDCRICIEYDCAVWHKPEHDARRDKYLLSHGWRILRIKSGELLPTLEQLETALNRLRGGETYVEIILSDWGGE